MKSKSPIMYGLAVFVVASLGAISYHQVAVINAPKPPNENVEDLNPQQQTTENRNDRLTFESNDKDLKMVYPDNWKLIDNTPENEENMFGKVLQSFVITNFEPSNIVSGGLPENAVRIEGVISMGGSSRSLDQIIDCTGKTINCENVEINGNLFKRATHKLNTGNTLIQLASKNQDKIYQFSAVLSTGNNYQENLIMSEKVLKSISIIK